MRTPIDRPKAAIAGPDLKVLTLWEDFLAWFLHHTARWPKSVRFTVTQRLQNLALQVLEDLVQARYQRRGRLGVLVGINLRLEKIRYLCRVARTLSVQDNKGFETTMRHVDETGRMLHGWRESLRQPSGGEAKDRAAVATTSAC